jgi:dihydrofolate synthase/folylpolyglutamate synthase
MGAVLSSAEQQLTTLLSRYGRFGVDLSLARIEHLLEVLGNPQRQVPIVHVAGTNGKGSVCAYLSSVLATAGYRVGRYTSPHLVSWCERICVNEQPIAPLDLLTTLQQVEAAIAPDFPCPTQFEIFTAAAWMHFAQQAVDIAVVEVGLGGRLDATNVVDHPLVTVITSISRDHWQRLGPTLGDIAAEKSGILKPACPAVIAPQPPEVTAVLTAKAQAVNCPTLYPAPAVALGDGWVEFTSPVASFSLRYQLPFLGTHQLINSALAIAALQLLHNQGWERITPVAIATGIAQARWPGRLEWTTWYDAQQQPQRLLLDGAHNGAAAQVLRQYIDSLQPPHPTANPTAWLMGMLDTKDHTEILTALLRPGDHLYLVPVPGHLSADPRELQILARTLCPELAICEALPNLSAGLEALAQSGISLKIFCGSLYLLGEFLKGRREE